MRTMLIGAAVLTAALASAQTIQNHPYISAEQSNAIANEWTKPMEPFKILGNVYYVGAQNIGSYLFTTPQGHILLDTGMPAMHQAVKANIEKLGFKLSDIKIMISSHAHIDHIGGHAEMKKATGAQVVALAQDAKALESGKDLSPVEYLPWAPVKVDRVIKDGDTVSLGGVTLKAVVDRLRGMPAITELRSAVIWTKAVSCYTPDYYVEALATSPWIHQPFEEYDNLRPEGLAKKFAV